jgi:hypothetical protein
VGRRSCPPRRDEEEYEPNAIGCMLVRCWANGILIFEN